MQLLRLLLPTVFAIVYARGKTTSFAIADAFPLANTTKETSLSLPLLSLPLLTPHAAEGHMLLLLCASSCPLLQANVHRLFGHTLCN